MQWPLYAMASQDGGRFSVTNPLKFKMIQTFYQINTRNVH